MDTRIIGSLIKIASGSRCNSATGLQPFLVHRQFNTFLTLVEISLNSLTHNEGKDHA
jgi:hypothetical protein